MKEKQSWASDLREVAESRLNPPRQSTETDDLIHELQVHQIELELQNEELRQNELSYFSLYQRYEDLFETSPAGLCSLDRDGRILEINRTLLKLISQTKPYVIGHRFHDFVARQSRREYGEAFDLAFNGGATQSVTLTLRTRSAETRAKVDIHPIVEGTDVLRCQVSVTDVTEIETARKQLESTVAELKLTQQKLVQQERLAVVGELASGIAHDMNNSLQTILIRSQLLETLATSESEAHVSSIVSAAEHAASVVSQILDFAQSTPSQPSTFDPSEFLSEIVAFLSPLIPDNIKLTSSRQPTELCIDADKSQIQQVISNLVLNARDAMPVGGGVISVDLRSMEIPRGLQDKKGIENLQPRVTLSVTDNGTGIPTEILPRIFEPFFSTKPKGSGLGLSQVYGLVHQNGGEVTVSSQPGKTQFTAYLPAVASGGVQPDTNRYKSAPSGEPPHISNILIVDDQPSVLEALRFAVESLGHRVHTAASGEEALQIYTEHSGNEHSAFSHILCDVNMPGMGGPELARILSDHDPSPHFVLMSGNPLPEELRLPCPTDWLQKPVGISAIASALSNATTPIDEH